MKKFAVLCLLCSSFFSLCVTGAEKPRVVVAYVTSWTRVMPDPQLMTHINYAFGHVNETFDGVVIDNERRLRDIVGLKAANADLKVLLSVGGWGSGRFSEMAATSGSRESFARDCRRVVDEFGLDGIDIDWEYPTQNSAGISCSPHDTENFTLLMAELRKRLGKRKLLTIATVADAKYIDFEDCVRYMDFVNVMSYDMGNPPHHHASLYPSPLAGFMTSSGAVDAHLQAGVPAEKLVMGLAFYGRGSHDNGLGDFCKTHRLAPMFSEAWDDAGQVPYVKDASGQLVLGFDNPYSLSLKCQYIIDRNLRGGMYWEYGDDDCRLDKSRTVAMSLLQAGRGCVAPRRILVLAERGGDHEPFTAAALQWLEDNVSRFNAELTVLSSARELQPGELDNYHMVLQLNYPPFAWSEAGARDFERYIDEGRGGYVGFHHASLLGEFDGYGLWGWFSDFLGKIRYKNYIAATADGTVQTEDASHPVMKSVPLTFVIPSDEWYTYETNPRPNVHVLAHVDECSYTVDTDIKMGDHPVIWTQPSKPGRNVYFQFGHSRRLLGDSTFLLLLENSIRWALGD